MTGYQEQLVIVALLNRLGGKAELTDRELMEAEVHALETWRTTNHTTILVNRAYPQGPLQDLGEATIEPDNPKELTP